VATFSTVTLTGSTTFQGKQLTGSTVEMHLVPASVVDQVYLYAVNQHATLSRVITVEGIDNSAGVHTSLQTLLPKEGLSLVWPGFPMTAGASVKAFASVTADVRIFGFVHRFGATANDKEYSYNVHTATPADGVGVNIDTASTAGNSIHVVPASSLDRIELYASNLDPADQEITIEWFDATTTNNITVTIPAQQSIMNVVPGLYLPAAAAVNVFATKNDVINIYTRIARESVPA